MAEFKTKVVGVSFKGRQANIDLVRENECLFWKQEFTNPYDNNAIALFVDSSMRKEVGHLRRPVAKRFVELLGQKKKPIVIALKKTGGLHWPQHKGLNIRIIY